MKGRNYLYIFMKALHMVSFILLVVGGLNWLVVGVAQLGYGMQFDLVTWLFGAWPALVSVVYILVGVSAVYQLWTHKKDCKACSTS
jgi:uncharacterized membrane protein YuzA (DUF378 family)